MIDPLISLAFSVYSNKGVYALLLGSGVSRTAQIPTGWEVILDLTRKVARLYNEDCEPDPAAWYRAKFQAEPDYSMLLNMLAQSPAERSQLLRSYFEPTEEEREQGLKTPTEAHRAIAELVAAGFIRVVVTTNFDRLIESAIAAAGVTPTVISTADAVEGALPLQHSACIVLKLHGDYLDTRIKNTQDELQHYDERLNTLLDRIFDEYGLIVCGWSSYWDPALYAALSRCQNHRFTTYWTARGRLGENAEKLVALRRAQVISIEGADTFFRELAEKVFALEECARPHPLSTPLAIARLKKYLVDERYRIRLHDLIMGEVEKCHSEMSAANFPVQNVSLTAAELSGRIQRYEALTETLQALMATGCYWGEAEHERLWTSCLERMVSPLGGRNGIVVWLNLRLYPALLLLYAGGMAALAAERHNTFAALLVKAQAREERGDDRNRVPLVYALYPGAVIRVEHAKQLPGMARHYTPLSDHLYDVLREPLREFLPHDSDYEQCFDRFEYLLGLVYADVRQKRENSPNIRGPMGRFAWKYHHYYIDSAETINRIGAEATAMGQDWPPLLAGLFDGSLERFQSIKSGFDQLVQQLNWF